MNIRRDSFFGRRKGKSLTIRQENLYKTLFPHLCLKPKMLLPSRTPAILFDPPTSDIWLEIGFGGGEHLIEQANKNPHIGFIGVEPFINGMAKALVGIEENQLINIRLYDEDATNLLDWLPPQSISRIFLLYPDPWPKKRHWKRRFVGPANLMRIARLLKPQGFFHFATDIDDYANWTLKHIHRIPTLKWTAQSARDWQQPWDDWVTTRYEEKAYREERKPYYFIFRQTITSPMIG